MTEGWRPAHRRGRGKYPLRGNLHTRWGGGGVLQRDLHAKGRGDYPLRGNLHRKGGITLHRKRGKSANKGRDTPVRQRK